MASDPFAAYQNPDGKTYDGARMMADICKLSTNEVQWTFSRLRQLMHVEGKSKDEAKAIVKVESKSRPWESNHGQ